MADDMSKAMQAVFGSRKRGYSEPIKRAYSKRDKKFDDNVVEEAADEAGISLRMVEACLREYRALLRDLRQEGHLLNSAQI